MRRLEIIHLLGGPRVLVRTASRVRLSAKRSVTGAGRYPHAGPKAPLPVAEERAAYGERHSRLHHPAHTSAESTPFKMSAVEHLATALGVSADELLSLIGLSGRTAQRRWSEGELSEEESDRLYRVARLLQQAIETLGSLDGAARWLKRPQEIFRGAAPFALLGSDAGAKEVDDQLGRIAYGVFA